MKRMERVQQWQSDRRAEARRRLDVERARLILADPTTWTDAEIEAIDAMLHRADMTWQQYEDTFKPHADADRLRRQIEAAEREEHGPRLDALQREHEDIARQIEQLHYHDLRRDPLVRRANEITLAVRDIRKAETALQKLRNELAALERHYPEVRQPEPAAL